MLPHALQHPFVNPILFDRRFFTKKYLPFLALFAEPREINEFLLPGIRFAEIKPDRNRIHFEELRKKIHFRFVDHFHVIPVL